MGTHIIYGASVKSIATSDDDWYGAASEVGAYVNKQAHRSDITAVVATTAGMGAPACFIPALAEIHINTEIVPMGASDKVNLADRLWKLEHAPAVGAMTHEAAHAAHTRFDPRDLMDNYGATRKMIDVITTLEEPRIEAQAMRTDTSRKVFLRGCAMEIVGRDFKIPDSLYGAAAAAGLLLARVDAKVLTKAEVKGFRDEITGVLGEDTLGVLEPLWQRFLMLHDRDFTGMVEIAGQWLDALHEDHEDASGMVGTAMMGEPLPGDPDESEGGEGGTDDGTMGDRIKAKARITETNIDAEVAEARGHERADRRRREREADSERRREGERERVAAFPPSHGFSDAGFAHFVGRREPTTEERTAARRLARELEKIDYRDRAVTRVTSVVPPGRLRGRVAVQAAAAVEQGRDFEGEAWRGKRRLRVEHTPLLVGLMGDISGSMSEAMEPLASTQWVVSTAGHHIDAKVASVHFGSRIHGIAPAGMRERDVRLFYPGDGSEAFRAGALAIDAELDLLNGTGARLLIVSSDGQYVNSDDRRYAETFVPLAQRKGVAVIFLDFTGSMTPGAYGAQVVDCQGASPATVAALVGKACIAEMRKMDSRAG